MAGFRDNFVSIFEDVAKTIEEMDLPSAKELLINKIQDSRVNDQSKKKMISIIESKNNLFSLLKYVWDAILAYKGQKVVSEDLDTELPIFEENFSEFGDEIPIFILVEVQDPQQTFTEIEPFPEFEILDWEGED